MKIGMNLLLWATQVTEEHYPQLELIKSTGFDGVEVPVFGGDDAHYHKLRRKLDELQLKASTVTIATPEANAISPDPSIRQAAVERLKTIVRRSAPRAMRIPSSRVLCVTASIITAAMPLVLIRSASAAKTPSSVVVTRGAATDSY